jgi:hypothetical protein
MSHGNSSHPRAFRIRADKAVRAPPGLDNTPAGFAGAYEGQFMRRRGRPRPQASETQRVLATSRRHPVMNWPWELLSESSNRQDVARGLGSEASPSEDGLSAASQGSGV